MSKTLFEVDVSMSLPVYADGPREAKRVAREVLTMELAEAELSCFDIDNMSSLPHEWAGEVPYGEEKKTCAQILTSKTT